MLEPASLLEKRSCWLGVVLKQDRFRFSFFKIVKYKRYKETLFMLIVA